MECETPGSTAYVSRPGMYSHLVGGGFRDGKENRASCGSRGVRRRHLHLPRAAASLVLHHSLSNNDVFQKSLYQQQNDAGQGKTALDWMLVVGQSLEMTRREGVGARLMDSDEDWSPDECGRRREKGGHAGPFAGCHPRRLHQNRQMPDWMLIRD